MQGEPLELPPAFPCGVCPLANMGQTMPTLSISLCSSEALLLPLAVSESIPAHCFLGTGVKKLPRDLDALGKGAPRKQFLGGWSSAVVKAQSTLHMYSGF